MQIVLPGALPDQGPARELFKHLATTAPTFAKWCAQGRARIIPAPVDVAGCTALEQWQLRNSGFTPAPNQLLAAGLGPLLLQDASLASTEPIWLAELVHISPSRDGAVLIPAAQLIIDKAHCEALLESALPLFEGSGFSVRDHRHTHWRITPPENFAAVFASPDLVAITSVNDWWTQREDTRPWRRLFNELQMLWFEHPVNLERNRNGLPAINGLWLFGGASRQQFSRPLETNYALYSLLQDYAVRQDWSGWLSALAQLERTVFSPMSGQQPPEKMVLTGRDRIIEITPENRWWKRLIKSNATSDSWNAWW